MQGIEKVMEFLYISNPKTSEIEVIKIVVYSLCNRIQILVRFFNRSCYGSIEFGFREIPK